MRGDEGAAQRRLWIIIVAVLALAAAASPVHGNGPPPRLDSVAPAQGPAEGGTEVTLRGKHLLETKDVSFGDAQAAFEVHGDDRVVATSPPHAAGTVDIVVTTATGSRSIPYEYLPPPARPSITSVQPAEAPVGGGTEVTIRGSALGSATGVSFGSAPAASWRVVDDQQILAVAPAHSQGTVDLLVATPNGSATHPFSFVAPPPPVIDALSPAAGPTGGGTEVQVTGQHLADVTHVTFGGAEAASLQVESDSRLVAVTPAHPAGEVEVVVRSPGGSAAAAFTYEPAGGNGTGGGSNATPPDNATQPADPEDAPSGPADDGTGTDTTSPTASPTPAPEQGDVLDGQQDDATGLGVPADILGMGRPDAAGDSACWVLLAPSAPGDRIVVPFWQECGVEAVVVQVPDHVGLLNVSVAPLPEMPQDIPPPGIRTGPGLIFEATLRDLAGREVQPTNAILQVRLPGAWLEACPPSACATTLFHYDGSAWSTHRMRSVDHADGMVVMQADVPSFSLFAVGGIPVPPEASSFPMWTWGLLAVGAVSAPAVAVAVRRRSVPHEDPKVNRLLEEMADRDELLQFINNAAHDLANPLTPIQLQLDLLAEAATQNDPEQQRQAVGLVQQNVEQLTMLVNDLRDASKLRSGRLRLFPALHDLRGIVSDAVASFAVQAADAGVGLGVVACEQPVPVRVDRNRIIQALTNLVGNALKFTSEGGAIEVCVDVHDGRARVQVKDDGLGLTREEAANLFQPFSQGHDDAHKSKGTGLGLFITKGIIEGHWGLVGCRSAGRGRGSTFWFTLPLEPNPGGGYRPSPPGASRARARPLVGESV